LGATRVRLLPRNATTSGNALRRWTEIIRGVDFREPLFSGTRVNKASEEVAAEFMQDVTRKHT
jgi:hypothetical protein